MLSSERGALFFPNLPNIWTKWPHLTCLGKEVPVISMKDPLWHKVLFDWFWNSSFGEDADGVLGYWRRYKKEIEEVSSLASWERLSHENPQKMLKLPWIEHKSSLGVFVKEVFQYFKKEDEGSGRVPDYTESIEQLKQRFRERLEEEFHFLGSRFALPVEVREQAYDFLFGKFITNYRA